MESIPEGYSKDELCVQCQGKGCKLCDGDGYITVGGREAPKVFIDAPEYEKDKLVTQLGKLKEFMDPTSRKEYGMAFTFYREHGEIAAIVDTDEFTAELEKIFQELVEYQLDDMKPIKNMIGIISKMQDIVTKLQERSKLSTIHFESSIRVLISRQKEMDKKMYDIQQENKKIKNALMKQAGEVPETEEAPAEEEEEAEESE